MTRNRSPIVLAAVVCLAMLAAACAGSGFRTPGAEKSADSVQSGEGRAESVRPGAPQAAPAPAGAAAARSAAAPAASAPQQANQVPPIDYAQRLIVRNANLTLLVDDVGEVAVRARRLADALGGFVVNSVQREENGRPAATVTIRVPADRFEEAMERLRSMSVRVSNEQASSRDVTDEYVDTDARLRNLRATEERYLALLQQARTVDDILKVEQQLSNIRGQIEQLQGRLQLLQRSTDTSLITVELRPYAFAQSPAGEWSLAPVLRTAWAALLNTLQLALSALVWVFVFSPLWLPLGYLVWRARRRRTDKAPSPAAAGEGRGEGSSVAAASSAG